MSTQKAEMIDVHEWDAEESKNNRELKREEMIKKIETSVEANDGNKVYVRGMLKKGATDTKKHRCAGAYIWYSCCQNPQTGETPYTDESEWKDRSPTWTHYMATAIGESGAVERKKMMNLIGNDQKTLHSQIVEACQIELNAFEIKELKKAPSGVKRPKLKLESFKIGTCEVQLGDDDAYNDHMKNLHGVITNVSSKKHKSNIYPNLNASPSSGGGEKILTELVPTLKVISHSTGNHIPITKLQAKPGRKEVEMGIEDLKTNLIADGRLVPGATKTHLDHYGHVTQRMLELVHENDHPAMKRTYAQLAKHKWERGHEVNIENMEKAIREIINKNSAELAMKKFDEYRFSEKIGLSSQLVDVANMVEEFYQDEMQIIAYEKSGTGEEEPLVLNPVYSKVLKDAFCIYKIVTKAPEYENSGYKGLIRKLLQASMENISLFNIDTVCEELKNWETNWEMFEERSKPADRGDKAAANVAEGGAKKVFKRKDLASLPPVEKKELEALKQVAAKANFTTTSFREHSRNVDAATLGKNSKRLCYWCVQAECLAGRLSQWYKDHPNEPKSTSYKEFRSKVDRFTNKSCTEYSKIDKRKEQGAVIYTATIEEEGETSNNTEDSMTSNESLVTPPQEVYHCYISCQNFKDDCKFPEKCKQLRKTGKRGRKCPIKQVLQEHECGYEGEMPESHFNEMNKERKLKWRWAGVKEGMDEDIVKFREARDYTPDDVIQANYAVQILSRSNRTTEEPEENDWRTEDESRFYRDGGYIEHEAEGSEAEVEEYVVEDPYDEVKRFAELTEEEVDVVTKKLRVVSPKFSHIIRPEIRGGEEEEKFMEELEKWATDPIIIYLVMPQNAEFLARQNKGEEMKSEVEEMKPLRQSANASRLTRSEIEEIEEIRQSRHSAKYPAEESNKKSKIHHSTDMSSNEEDTPEKKQKPKKKKYSKTSTVLDSASEEEEMLKKTSPIRGMSNLNISVIPDRSRSDMAIRNWQRKNAQGKEAGLTKKCKVKTMLFNGIFQRESEETEETSENKQEINRKVKCRVGTKAYPLMGHSIEQEEKNRGQKQHQNKLPWWTGISTAMWLLWVAIISGIYPIYQVEPLAEQTEERNQDKESRSTEQPEPQVWSQMSEEFRPELIEKPRKENPGEKAKMQ